MYHIFLQVQFSWDSRLVSGTINLFLFWPCSLYSCVGKTQKCKRILHEVTVSFHHTHTHTHALLDINNKECDSPKRHSVCHAPCTLVRVLNAGTCRRNSKNFWLALTMLLSCAFLYTTNVLITGNISVILVLVLVFPFSNCNWECNTVEEDSSWSDHIRGEGNYLDPSDWQKIYQPFFQSTTQHPLV